MTPVELLSYQQMLGTSQENYANVQKCPPRERLGRYTVGAQLEEWGDRRL